MKKTNLVRVFVASPGDVSVERAHLDNVIQELNRTVGEERDFVLKLLKWETHTYPAIGRPQGVINKQIGPYDIFIGIMWKRFGSPTGVAESGTEEEFNVAYKLWKKSQNVHIAFYFSDAPYLPHTLEENKQQAKVIEFRQRLSSLALVSSYGAPEEFAHQVREHLFKILNEIIAHPQRAKKNVRRKKGYKNTQKLANQSHTVDLNPTERYKANFQLEAKESERLVTSLLKLEGILHERVVGQEDAINIVSKAIRRLATGFTKTRGPICSFIFTGPTGVGKTYLGRVVAEFLFGVDERTGIEKGLVELSMSEYTDRPNISRLIGFSHSQGGVSGRLTEQVHKNPNCVVLLNEIEKAHPDVFGLIQTIIDTGYLVDGNGDLVDFRGTILIMTGNIGSQIYTETFQEGKTQEEHYNEWRDLLVKELLRIFSREFLNRIDGIVYFRRLTLDDLIQIVDMQLELLEPKLKNHNITLEVTTAAKEQLVREGYDKEYGARPLERKIQQLFEDPLTEGVLSGEFPENSKVTADVIDGWVRLTNKDIPQDRPLEELATPDLD